VQGVGFRFQAKQQADTLGISGFVRNEDDGSVSIEAEGEEEQMEQFIEWCRRGPRYARVEKVDIEEGIVKNYNMFQIA
jgi:acylphosphatase